LSGGAARGLAHIGVLKVVEETGVPVGALAGTSMGAIIGGLWAAGHSAQEILEIAREASWLKMINFSPKGGILSEKKLMKFLSSYLPSDFSGLEIPFVAVATDVVNGRSVYLHQGPLASAIVASAAYPGLFAAIPRDDLLLIDGGVFDNLPVDAARFLGSEKVIASDVGYDPELEPGAPKGVIELGRRAIDLMQAQLTRVRLAMNPPELYIKPLLPGIGLESFGMIETIWRSGYEAAMKALKGLEV